MNMQGIYIKTPKIIEEEYGKKFVDICIELSADGLSPTEIAEKLKLKTSRYITQALYDHQTKPNEDSVLYIGLYESIQNKNDTRSIEELFPLYSGGVSFEEFLRDEYLIKKKSSYEISSLIGCSQKNITLYLNQFHKSSSQ